jgi:hypothetical protein
MSLAVALSCSGAVAANAQYVTGSNPIVTQSGSPSVDLTALTSAPGSDWAHYGGPTLFDDKQAGGGQISDAGQINYGTPTSQEGARYSGNETTFNWSDGTSTPSASTNTGVYNGNFGPGSGFGLTVAASATPEQLLLWVGSGGDTTEGTLTATIDGQTFTNIASWSSGNSDELYTLNFEGTAPGDQLNVTWIADNGSNGGHGNVTVQAAAVTDVPEPGTLALFATSGLSTLGLLSRRSRRR